MKISENRMLEILIAKVNLELDNIITKAIDKKWELVYVPMTNLIYPMINIQIVNNIKILAIDIKNETI